MEKIHNLITLFCSNNICCNIIIILFNGNIISQCSIVLSAINYYSCNINVGLIIFLLLVFLEVTSQWSKDTRPGMSSNDRDIAVTANFSHVFIMSDTENKTFHFAFPSSNIENCIF